MQEQTEKLAEINTLSFPIGERIDRKARSIAVGQECVLHDDVSLTWDGYTAFETLCIQWLTDPTVEISTRLEKVLSAVYNLTQYAQDAGLTSLSDADVHSWATIPSDPSLPEKVRVEVDRERDWAQFALILDGDTLVPSVKMVLHRSGLMPLRRDDTISTVDLGNLQHVTLDESAISSLNEKMGRYCRNYLWEKRPFATSVESTIRDLLMYIPLIIWYAKVVALAEHQTVATAAHVRLAIIEIERDNVPARCRDRTQTVFYLIETRNLH